MLRRRMPAPTKAEQILSDLWTLRDREAEADKTVWSKERVAEQYGHVLDDLWEQLNGPTNKSKIASLSFETIVVPSFEQPVDFGIGNWHSANHGKVGKDWSWDQWRSFWRELDANWTLEHVEFSQTGFDTNETTGGPKQSRYYCRGDLANKRGKERITARGSDGLLE